MKSPESGSNDNKINNPPVNLDGYSSDKTFKFPFEQTEADIKAVKEVISYIANDAISYEDALHVFTQYKNISEDDLQHALPGIYGIESKETMIATLKEELESDEKYLADYLSRNN